LNQLPVDTYTLIAFVLALIGGLAAGLIGYAVSRLVAPSKDYPMKYERFEAGNPPTKKGRGWFTMQYYAYLVVFLTVEPVFIYLFLLLMEAHVLFFSVVQLFGLILLMLIPPIIFGLDAARKISLWRITDEAKK
jgi:NADH-quinone oxidoreductase subunit A